MFSIHNWVEDAFQSLICVDLANLTKDDELKIRYKVYQIIAKTKNTLPSRESWHSDSTTNNILRVL
jgi:hypothetical protein